ncbi:MAG: hypothetical protein ACE5FI_02660 [Anaerolineales bacterium]
MADDNLAHETATAGDAAVDGLFAGFSAGVLMAAYLVLAGLVAGEGPGAVLGRFAAAGAAPPLLGALSHLAASAVDGMVFALGWRLVRRAGWSRLPAWSGGLLFAAALLLVAELAILPASSSPLREIPLVHFAVAHVVYGMALGWLVGRRVM